MTKINAVKRMLDKANDRYGETHPISEALQRQYNALMRKAGAEASRENPALTD